MGHIAIIPARSGSKGLPDKNIRDLCGKPLMAYSIEVAIGAGVFDEIMVSTDSERYSEIAKAYGAAVPFLRSKENSSDTAGSWGAVLEVLREYEKRGRRFDTICLLQPTSPLRSVEDIHGAYRVLEEKKANAVTSVCQVAHSPTLSMILPEDDSLGHFREKLLDVPRQKMDTYYQLNGAVYIRRIQYREDGMPALVEKPEYAYRMERMRSVDIDEEEDFLFAEMMMEKINDCR